MQTTDLAIKYKNLYQTAVLMLDNIKNLGYDISEYESILKSISTNVHDNIKANYIKGFARANYEIDHLEAKKLVRMKNKN